MRFRIVSTISVLAFVVSVILLVLALIEHRAATATRRQIEVVAEQMSLSATGLDIEQRHHNAARASALAQAKAASDPELSRLLLLNAVNQEPSNLQYLNA